MKDLFFYYLQSLGYMGVLGLDPDIQYLRDVRGTDGLIPNTTFSLLVGLANKLAVQEYVHIIVVYKNIYIIVLSFF